MLAYVKAKQQIIKYIKKNQLEKGDKLPSESELSEMLGISRLTLREGLNALRHEGIIVSLQGKGTYVTCNIEQIANTLNNNLGITEMLETFGYKPGVGFFEKKLVKADKQLSETLQVDENSDLIMCRRVRTADGKAVILSEDYLAPSLSKEFLSITDENVSIYEFLEGVAKVVIGLAITELKPVLADKYLAEKLEIDEGYPLLAMETIVHSGTGEAIVFAKEFFIPESFKFIVHRSR